MMKRSLISLSIVLASMVAGAFIALTFGNRWLPTEPPMALGPPATISTPPAISASERATTRAVEILTDAITTTRLNSTEAANATSQPVSTDERPQYTNNSLAGLPADHPLSPDELFRLASPAVVRLVVKDEDGHPIVYGSGFVTEVTATPDPIISAVIGEEKTREFRSTVVTNYHVIRPAFSIDVEFTDGQIGSAWFVEAEDAKLDVAALWVVTGTPPPRRVLLSNVGRPTIGDRVFVIGSPRGLQNSLSEGLISGFRQIDDNTYAIQTTAPISPGSSGGPLLSTTGSVLGVIRSSIVEGQNLNFAIPAEVTSEFLGKFNGRRAIDEGATVFASIAVSVASDFTQLSFKPLPLDKSAAFSILPAELEEPFTQQMRNLCQGDKAQKDGRYDDAIRFFTAAVNSPVNRWKYLAHFGLGYAILLNRNEGTDTLTATERAAACLEESVRLEPNFAPSRYRLCYCYEVLSFQDKYWARSLAHAENLVRLLPRSWEARKIRGTLWVHFRERERFEADFAEALSLRPGYGDTYIELGRGRAEFSDYRSAIEMYKKGLACENQSPYAKLNGQSALAYAYQETGEFQEAISLLQEIVRETSGSTAGAIFESQLNECRAKQAAQQRK